MIHMRYTKPSCQRKLVASKIFIELICGSIWQCVCVCVFSFFFLFFLNSSLISWINLPMQYWYQVNGVRKMPYLMHFWNTECREQTYWGNRPKGALRHEYLKWFTWNISTKMQKEILGWHERETAFCPFCINRCTSGMYSALEYVQAVKDWDWRWSVTIKYCIMSLIICIYWFYFNSRTMEKLQCLSY